MPPRFALLILLLGFAPLPVMAEPPGSAPHPNIIVFLADDMGMGDTSAYQDWSGNPDHLQIHTPNLQRLANRGIRFTDAHSPHSRCSTSRYALLTGRYCWRTPLKHWVLFGVQCDPLLERDRPTLASFLKQYDYQTGMVGKWHLGLRYRQIDGSPAEGWDDADLTKPLVDGPIQHGFDFFHGISRSHPTSGPHKKGANTPEQSRGPGWIQHNRVLYPADDGKKLRNGSYLLAEIGPELHTFSRRFLTAATINHPNLPFFLYFAAPSNHTPHTPCQSLGPDKLPVAGASKFVNGQLTKSTRFDFIHENDLQVGLLLDYLRQTDDRRRPGHKLIDNTLFIFASDNGAENKSKTATGPLRSNKGSVYEGGHRIPFLASWPLGGIGDGNPATPGQTSSRLLGLNDLFATFADILGQPLPDPSMGEKGAEDSHSQLAAMRAKNTPPRPPLFPNDHKEASKNLADRRAVVAVRSNAAPIPGQWKLLLDHRFAFQGELHPLELYNLATDQQEQKNLLNDPHAQPALHFLLTQAKSAAGDSGHSR